MKNDEKVKNEINGVFETFLMVTLRNRINGLLEENLNLETSLRMANSELENQKKIISHLKKEIEDSKKEE
jgi:hypothetical protein